MVGLSDAAELESETETSLASRVPPELFENILFYVNVNCNPQLHEDQWRFVRNRGQPSPVDVLSDLKWCSLVCLFCQWANICRQYMFSGKTVEITCFDDAEVFVRHVVRGCPRITPVHQLIRSSSSTAADGHESKKNTTSFLHLLYLHKLQWLFIHGQTSTPQDSIHPTVTGLGAYRPPWSSQTPIKSIHLPSFYHVTKY
ncbi:hypothetical protein BC629DRAFT_968313 [Irpex lacteus]|nr:hypothetical protein BC629DRAFT_968313 [Irpex lacteus]